MNPPPPVAPNGGAPPGGLAITPTSYSSLYRTAEDPLAGDYGPWTAAHAVGGTNTPASIRETMLTTSNSVPKAYLMMVPGLQGTPVIKMVYRPELFRSVPGVPTPHDGQVYCNATDIGPGNQITTAVFPPNAFHMANEVRAPDTASMAAAWAENPQAAFLGPFAPEAPNTVLYRSRFLMIVPQPYIPLFLGATLKPKEAWMLLATAIFNDDRAVSCAPLLEWLISACTLLPAAAGQDSQYPVVHEALVVPIPDHALALHRWQLVLVDLPQLAGASRSQDQAIMHAISAFQQANVQTAAAAQLDRVAARAPKLPSSRFPSSYQTLMHVTGAASENELPTIWHDLANAAKSEYRQTLAKGFVDASERPYAATESPPLVDKETLNIFLQMTLTPHTLDDLELGLQLYRFVPGPDIHESQTHVRNELFDLVYSGTTTPSLSDIQALASTKVFIPTDQYGLTTALQRHSLALEVYLGPQHPFCVFYRTWIKKGWLRNETEIRHFNAEFYHDLPGKALSYGKFSRWISLRINGYLRWLPTTGIATPLPDLYAFGTLIANRENRFPPIPSRYLESVQASRPVVIPAPAPARPVAQLSPPTGLAQQSPARTSEPERNTERDTNPRPIQAIKTAFAAIGLRVKKCYDLLEPPKRAHGFICLTYHGSERGSCFKACGKAPSHRVLSAEDQSDLIEYCGLVQAAKEAAA